METDKGMDLAAAVKRFDNGRKKHPHGMYNVEMTLASMGMLRGY